MNFIEYQKLALVTNSKTATSIDNLQHGGYGLVTEVGEIVDAYKRVKFYKKELDKVNLLEEIGDVMWYLAIASYAHELDLTSKEEEDLGSTEGLTSEGIIARLSHHASNVFICSCAYSEEDAFHQYIDYDLGKIMTLLRYLCKVEDLDYNKAKEVNIAKLEARYPEGFSEHRALNRDIEAERKILEN